MASIRMELPADPNKFKKDAYIRQAGGIETRVIKRIRNETLHYLSCMWIVEV